jgi:two-component system CheB/CheR fusion protein
MKGQHFIIAIGGSAGSLEAIQEFFDQTVLGHNSYIIIRHLPEDYFSRLKEILEHHSKLSIVNVDRAMPLQINTVYIGPSDKDIIIKGGQLQLVKREIEAIHYPVDLFFQSLAEGAIGKRAIAIVLSGVGSDGTKGIQNIKKAGGMVIAQDPESCLQDMMPRYAIGSGFVDHIAAPSEMPKLIRSYTKSIESISNKDVSSRTPPGYPL